MDKVLAAFKEKFAFDKMILANEKSVLLEAFNKMDTNKAADGKGEFGITKEEAEEFYNKKYGGRKVVTMRMVKKLFKKDKDGSSTITQGEYLSTEHFEAVFNSQFECVTAEEDQLTTAEIASFLAKNLGVSEADSKAVAAELKLPSPCSRDEFIMSVFDLAFPVA